MKKFYNVIILSLLLATPAFAQENDSSSLDNDNTDRSLQLEVDLVLPYRVSSPDGRTATLFGAHAEYFIVPAWSVGLQGIFGIEDEGFTDNPVYIAPGVGFYPMAGKTFEPYVRADVPFLLNAYDDFGARAGLGVMWNTGVIGLGVRYSFDGAYFFDSEDVILNLANVSVVINL